MDHPWVVDFRQTEDFENAKEESAIPARI